MDYAGTFMLMAGVTLILVYMTEGPYLGWTSLEDLAFLILGIVLTVYFFIFESKLTSPLIRLELLRIRNVLVANLIGIISSISMFLTYFAIIYYSELPRPYGLGLDIISTGLTLAPATIAMLFISPLIGRTLTKRGPRSIILAGSLIR